MNSITKLNKNETLMVNGGIWGYVFYAATAYKLACALYNTAQTVIEDLGKGDFSKAGEDLGKGIRNATTYSLWGGITLTLKIMLITIPSYIILRNIANSQFIQIAHETFIAADGMDIWIDF